jgi:hypothetical protein
MRRATSLAVAALVAVAPVAAADTPPDAARLLVASDPFAATPEELRVLLIFSTATSSARVPIELWRKGHQLSLIRFLARKDRGKFVIRRDGEFYFLTPGTKRPVRLAPALAPAGGAALDALLSVRPSRDYTIESATDDGGLVTYDLVARPAAAGAPRLRWVVDRARRVPVRAEFRSAEGRVERLVEFKRWRDAARLEPETIVAKEIARGGLPLTVEFLEVEPRTVPAELFELQNDAARAELPEPVLKDGP